MRRGQALKYQKDFKLAIEDFEEAKKLEKEGEKDAAKWIRLTQEDIVHEENIKKIMENAEALKGKEYIDYLLEFLKGKKDEKEKVEDKEKKRTLR